MLNAIQFSFSNIKDTCELEVIKEETNESNSHTEINQTSDSQIRTIGNIKNTVPRSHSFLTSSLTSKQVEPRNRSLTSKADENSRV